MPTGQHTGHLEPEDVETAAEFVKAIVPAGDRWQRKHPEHWQNVSPRPAWWVFRGQADANWKLAASAHRSGVLQKFLQDARTPTEFVKVSSFRERELLAVIYFLRACRGSHVEVPEDGGRLRFDENRLAVRFTRRKMTERTWKMVFPPRVVEANFAFAQHSGVPTRLLDWTGLPFVAAYFAAIAAMGLGGGGRMAVWALLRSEAHRWGAGAEVPKIGTDDVPATFRFVDVPSNGNRRLRAQGGLFTAVHSPLEASPGERPKNEERDVMSLDDVIRSIHKFATKDWPVSVPWAWLRKVTLPWSEAPELLRLLARMNVHAGTVYDDPAGVVESMRERRHWSGFQGEPEF